jgi:putative transposase
MIRQLPDHYERKTQMAPYEYRKMSERERQEMLEYCRSRRVPLHEPPHFSSGMGTYIITAACYEHRNIMKSADRRRCMQNELLSSICTIPQADIKTWVILPNHYHILLSVDLEILREHLTKIHKYTARQWNGQDAQPGRRVWFRFSDRRIRSDGHFYASVNYIHHNPVKHGHVESPTGWTASGVHYWAEEYGLNYLRTLWRDYPVFDYGKGWDD